MIVVTGATGNVGGATVGALVRDGVQVRAVSRSPRDWPAGVEGVTGDLDDADSVAPALAGAEAVFLLSGYQGLDGILAAARDQGVQRAVLLSSASVPGGDMGNAVARYHILSERSVKDSGLGWTMLQPRTFMTNTLEWAPQVRRSDVVRSAFGDVPVATIDPADVGAVAARALAESGHEGQTYALTGPDSLTPGDRVRILAQVLGRDLSFRALSDDEAHAQMSAAMPAEYVAAFFSFFVDGDLDESRVLDTVERVLGRPPASFQAWARAHAGAFV